MISQALFIRTYYTLSIERGLMATSALNQDQVESFSPVFKLYRYCSTQFWSNSSQHSAQRLLNDCFLPAGGCHTVFLVSVPSNGSQRALKYMKIAW